MSHALLRSVGAGETGESLRLYAPDNALLFSNLDARRPGYPRAVEIARESGYEPVIRLAGGHAAVFLEQSVAFAWASPDPEAQRHIHPRFKQLTGWIVSALNRLGLDARVGEVDSEYCPGEYSVNIGGHTKVMGVGQRVIRNAAHVGGVLTVGSTPALRDVLIPIYKALDLAFEPQTAGGVSDFDATLTPEQVITALCDSIEADGRALLETDFSHAVLSAAESLVPLHGPERDDKAGAALKPSLRVAGTKTLIQENAPRPLPRRPTSKP